MAEAVSADACLLFDPSAAGHRLSYLQTLTDFLHRHPQPVFYHFLMHRAVIERFLADGGQMHTTGYRLHACADGMDAHFPTSNKGGLATSRAIGRVAEMACDLGCGNIYFLHLDSALIGFWLRSFLPLSPVGCMGLSMVPTSHYRAMFGQKQAWRDRLFGGIKHAMIGNLLRRGKLARVDTFDHAYVQHVAQADPLPIFHIPDFAPMPETEIELPMADQPESWRLAERRFILFGSVEPRKGVVELLRCLPRIVTGRRVSILIAGKVAPELRAEIAGLIDDANRQCANISVHLVDRYVSDPELSWAIGQSHAVLAPYIRHKGSSGVLCWAAHKGKPVLSQPDGYLGWQVATAKLGMVADPQDMSALADALGHICDHDDGWFDGDALDAYADAHQSEMFARAMFAGITECVLRGRGA